MKSKQETSSGKLLGRQGEIFAAKYLENQGFRIIGRNVHTPYGEIDLVALNTNNTADKDAQQTTGHFTLDSDLIDLKPQHVLDLVQPVLEHEVDMAVGLFRHSNLLTDLSHWLTLWLTGQRCLRRELFTYISEDAARGYGFETALTIAAHQQKYKTRRVYLQGVSHPPSEDHRGFWQGVGNRVKMYRQIIQAWQKARTASPKRLPFRSILLVILALFLTASVLYNDRLATASLKPMDLIPLPIEDVRRLLVVAPHPDDETLGSGGLIQAILAQGGDVRVVFRFFS